MATESMERFWKGTLCVLCLSFLLGSGVTAQADDRASGRRTGYAGYSGSQGYAGYPGSVASMAGGALSDPGMSLSEVARGIVEATNAHRAAHGLHPLEHDPYCAAAALNHARDMAQNSFMSHTGSDGSDPGVRYRQTGASYRGVGENVAMNSRLSIEGTMNQWKTSSGHNKNMLNSSYTRMAAAVTRGSCSGFGFGGRECFYYVQCFSR